MGKKILIVANVAKEHILKFHIPIIKRLKENEWTVDVACIHDADIPYCDNQFDMSYKRNTISFATLKGVVELRKVIKNGEYDIVHCHTPTGGVVARLACSGFKKKPYVIYTAHGFHFYKGAPLVNWLVFFPIEWLLSFKTDYLITINEEDYQTAKNFKFHAKQIDKIPGVGVDISKYQRSTSTEKLTRLKEEFDITDNTLVLTYVAELIPNKNQIVLLKMLKILRDKYSKGHLILVGPDYYEGKYYEMAKNLGISQYVTFTGWRNDVFDILSITDVYVASSIREGLGINLIEAICCDLPIVASVNRGHSEVIANGVTGYLVSNESPEKYAEYVIEASDKRVVDEMIKSARRSVEHYKVSTINERIMGIYQQIVEKEDEYVWQEN